MKFLDEYLLETCEGLYSSFSKHLDLAKEFVEKVRKSEDLSEETKNAVIGLGIGMIASHFLGDKNGKD